MAGADDLCLTRGPRHYSVRGLARNLSADVLKVTFRLAPDASAADAALTPADESAGPVLLRDPTLAARIAIDLEANGVVGKGTDALVGYLAMVARLLAKPLAILIQPTSAADRSGLIDALLSLMPERQRLHYSAMTVQSLFYLAKGT